TTDYMDSSSGLGPGRALTLGSPYDLHGTTVRRFLAPCGPAAIWWQRTSVATTLARADWQAPCHRFVRGRPHRSGGWQRKNGALDVVDEGFRLPMSAFNPAHPGDHLLKCVESIRRLTGVRVAGQSLSRLSLCHIHVMSRRKLQGVFSIGDLVIVESE